MHRGDKPGPCRRVQCRARQAVTSPNRERANGMWTIVRLFPDEKPPQCPYLK